MRGLSYILPLLLATLAGCGAPAKSASGVSALFGKTETLQDIQSGVCGHISERSEPPTTKDLSMDLSGCQKAGEGAQNYLQVSEFKFVNVDGTTYAADSNGGGNVANRSGANGDPEVLHKSLRAQIWLNKSILDLASVLSTFMKSNKNANVGEIKLPDSATQSFKNLAQTKITMIEAPTIDMDNLAFAMTIEMQLTGIVKAYQKIEVNGRLFDKTFAVVARPVAKPSYKDSILQSIEIVVLLTPYAGDTYVDFYAAINMYDIGIQSVIDDQLSALMATMLKGTIDSIMVVKGES